MKLKSFPSIIIFYTASLFFAYVAYVVWNWNVYPNTIVFYPISFAIILGGFASYLVYKKHALKKHWHEKKKPGVKN